MQFRLSEKASVIGREARTGVTSIRVPQARGVEFYRSSLEKGARSERALTLAIAEIYVKGISACKVTDVRQELCGLDISSAQVSRATAELDGELEAWRQRPIGKLTYLNLDARYEKVRHGDTVVSAAMLTGIGVLPDGQRTILGVSCSLSEAEVHWREFLKSLMDSELHGVQLVVSDEHAGFRAAGRAIFPGAA